MCVSLRYEPVLGGVDVVALLKLVWYKQFMEGLDRLFIHHRGKQAPARGELHAWEGPYQESLLKLLGPSSAHCMYVPRSFSPPSASFL